MKKRQQLGRMLSHSPVSEGVLLPCFVQTDKSPICITGASPHTRVGHISTCTDAVLTCPEGKGVNLLPLL